MTVSGKTAVCGFGRQTDEGTALTVPKFESPMGSGGIQPERDVQPYPWTNDSRDNVGNFVSRTSGNFTLPVPLLPKSTGAILRAGLGDLTSDTDLYDPDVHTIIPADSLPWYTMFFGIGGEYLILEDAKVGTLQIAGSAGQPLEATMTGVGKVVERIQPAAKWGTASNDEPVEPFFRFIDSTIKLDVASTPATTTVHNVPNMSITVENNLDMIQTDEIGYSIIGEGARDVSVSCTDVVLEDFDFIKTVFFGSTTGTALSSQVVYGSMSFTFGLSDESGDAELVLSSPRLQWNVAQWPGADPAGVPIRYSLMGSASKPASGNVLTATLTNEYDGTDY